MMDIILFNDQQTSGFSFSSPTTITLDPQFAKSVQFLPGIIVLLINTEHKNNIDSSHRCCLYFHLALQLLYKVQCVAAFTLFRAPYAHYTACINYITRILSKECISNEDKVYIYVGYNSFYTQKTRKSSPTFHVPSYPNLSPVNAHVMRFYSTCTLCTLLNC